MSLSPWMPHWQSPRKGSYAFTCLVTVTPKSGVNDNAAQSIFLPNACLLALKSFLLILSLHCTLLLLLMLMLVCICVCVQGWYKPWLTWSQICTAMSRAIFFSVLQCFQPVKPKDCSRWSTGSSQGLITIFQSMNFQWTYTVYPKQCGALWGPQTYSLNELN